MASNLTPPQVTQLNLQQQGNLNFPSAAAWVDAIVLSAGVPTSYSIAELLANSKIKEPNVFLIFSADGPFWANFYGTAVIPTSNVVNGSASEFEPNQKYIDENVSAISFISNENVHVSIQVYEVG